MLDSYIYVKELKMDDIMDRVAVEVTREFCECFENDDCIGSMAKFIGMGLLPESVDESDPRVVAIIEKCRMAHETKK